MRASSWPPPRCTRSRRPVLSRCQRHEFRRIPVATISEALQGRCAAEGLQVEPRALDLIARQSTGSLRDAISLLDQLTSTGEAVSLEQAQQVLGTATSEAVAQCRTGTGRAPGRTRTAGDPSGAGRRKRPAPVGAAGRRVPARGRPDARYPRKPDWMRARRCRRRWPIWRERSRCRRCWPGRTRFRRRRRIPAVTGSPVCRSNWP